MTASSSGTEAHAAPPPASLWRDWTLSCAAGEIVGIGVAASVAYALTVAVSDPPTAVERWATLAALVGAGVVEGAAIGAFQWRVLRRVFPSVRARAWVGVTVFVAALGWLVGMLPSTVLVPAEPSAAPFDPTLVQTAGLAAATGLGAGLVFGGAQGLVLRRHARRAGEWVVGNALGWALALAWIYAAAALADPDAPFAAVLGLGVGAGVLAGLSVGAVTGVFLVRIARASGRLPSP